MEDGQEKSGKRSWRTATCGKAETKATCHIVDYKIFQKANVFQKAP